MNGDGDAHEAAQLMQQQHVQAARVQQQEEEGMTLLPMATSVAAEATSSNKPGLPPTPSQQPTFQSADACIMDVDRAAPRLPPRNKLAAHRRSRSEVPFGYLSQQQPTSDADDLFNAYLNLEGLDELNNFSDERHDDGDSRGSSMKTNGADDSSENDESEEGAAEKREQVGRLKLKRGAAGEPAAAPVARHARSLSMDSHIVGRSNFSAGGSGTSSAAANGVIPGSNTFGVEYGSVEFTPGEMNKIMADDRLAEMALEDPKRVKKVLANRRSAARSKERKLHYIAELEQKVQILHTQAATLSAQLTLLQRDSAAVAAQNNELKFRLEALDQEARLRDALNETLAAEVQRLNVVAVELGGSCSSNNLPQQIQINVQNQMFQLQPQQQAAPLPVYQLQHQQQSGAANNQESIE